MAWDTDVVDALASLDSDLVSLLFVAPHVTGKRRGMYSKQITEIWEGPDPENEGNNRVVMVGEDGVEYSGFFMEQGTPIRRERLVARVAASTRRRRSAANDD